MARDTPWAQSSSGRAVSLLLPQPGDIDLGDICRGLSRINRFSGATTGDAPWTVADHSVFVAAILRAAGCCDRTVLHGALHDAHEYATGDITSPMQRAIAAIYASRHPAAAPVDAIKDIQDRVQAAILIHLGIERPTSADDAAVRAADVAALLVERDQLMAPPPKDWGYQPEGDARTMFLLASKRFSVFAVRGIDKHLERIVLGLAASARSPAPTLAPGGWCR